MAGSTTLYAATGDAPCPPTLSLEGATSGDPDCGVVAATTDTEYGPTQIKDGQCPGIPTSFPTTYRVNTESEFASAYSSIQPGEAIVIEDGSYSWGTDRTLNKNGTESKPIYIVYETLQGAVFNNNNARFTITGSHHVIAGFRFNGPNDNVVRVNGPDNRIACHYMQNGGTSYIYTESNGRSDRTEVDNNVFDGNAGIAMNIIRCDPSSSSCTNNSIGMHIHHNTWKNKPSGGGAGNEAIKLGSGYHQPDGVKTYNSNANNLDAILENNLFENWNGEAELISIKADRNIIRNNCIKGSTISNIVVRTGSNNLITGNWSDTVKEGIRISGKGNYYVFNYRRAYRGGQMFRLHPGEIHTNGTRYVYTDATNNVLRYNVTSNMTRMVETEKRVGGSYTFKANPTGNIISDNAVYSDSLVGSNSSGSYVNADGRWSESQFRANNTWGSNTVLKNDLPASSCGNAALFNGPGGSSASVPGGANLLGSPATIKAPSWW